MVKIAIACAVLSSYSPYVKLVDEAAKRWNISPKILKTLVLVESHFNPEAKNQQAPVWSYGIGQLTRATAWDRCRLSFKQITNPFKNADCAAQVLFQQLARYHGNVRKAVSAYNAGTAGLPVGERYADVVWAHLACPI